VSTLSPPAETAGWANSRAHCQHGGVPSIQHVPSTDGVTLALIDLGGDGPPLLFCHPTGFHGMTWAPLAAHLAGVAHSWALDFRGHGDSSVPQSMDFTWERMVDDVLAVVDRLGITDIKAIGHSMGGAALLMAEMRRPGTFAALWLYEPIVLPKLDGVPQSNPIAATARRRRRSFPDRQAAYDNFAAKPPLNTLDAAALQAYVDHGLRPRHATDGDETVALKCRPEVEALVFENGVVADAFDRLAEVRIPVTVAASDDGGGPARVAGSIVDALPHGRLERFPELTHFGPMEDPAGIASAIRADLDLG
jgi:pimeloyl-ACP methyl ester carboxylesterase